MTPLRLRLTTSRWAYGVGLFLSMVWVGVIWRGILISSFPGNRDITGMIKQSTESISLGMPYEFTSAMGTRMSYTAVFFDPISFVQFIVGRSDALWTGFVMLIPLMGVGLLVLTRSARLSAAASLHGVVISAVLVAVPSSLRTAFPEFGGASFLLLFAIAPITWGVLRNLGGVTAVRLGREDVAFQVLLLWSISATGFSQAAVIWVVILLALGEISTAVWTVGIRQALRFLVRVSLHGLLALISSSAMFGSPILTILASANARENSFRGATAEVDLFLIWNELGTNTGIRSLTAASAVVSFVLLWRSSECAHRRFAYSAVSVLIYLVGYSLVYTLTFGIGIEIGPRPQYLASWLVTPLLAVLLGNLASFSLSSIAVRLRSRLPWGPSDSSLTAVAAVIPLLILAMFTLKNPTISADGVRPTNRIKPSEALSADPLLSSLREGRILIVDESQTLMGQALHPTDVFALTQNRELPEGVTRLTAHQHSTTRWQHFVFEGFGFNKLRAASLFLYARTFDANLARHIGTTHVVSDKLLTDTSLVLLKTDVSRGGFKRFLYGLAALPTQPADSLLMVTQETDLERATEMALRARPDDGEVIYVDRPASAVVAPNRADSEILRNRIELSLESSGKSAVVLPIEFSSCHYFVKTAGSSGRAELLPLNGRFLGVLFSGKVTGEIRFRQLGPRALACQMRDFLQTRHIG